MHPEPSSEERISCGGNQCPNSMFRFPNPEKSLMKISIFITLEREEEKIEKDSKNKFQHLGFVYSYSLGCPHCVYKI